MRGNMLYKCMLAIIELVSSTNSKTFKMEKYQLLQSCLFAVYVLSLFGSVYSE